LPLIRLKLEKNVGAKCQRDMSLSIQPPSILATDGKLGHQPWFCERHVTMLRLLTWPWPLTFWTEIWQTVTPTPKNVHINKLKAHYGTTKHTNTQTGITHNVAYRTAKQKKISTSMSVILFVNIVTLLLNKKNTCRHASQSLPWFSAQVLYHGNLFE